MLYSLTSTLRRSGLKEDGLSCSLSSITSPPPPSVLFSAAALERVHEAEGSQVLAQQNALLHGEDAVAKHTHIKNISYLRIMFSEFQLDSVMNWVWILKE